MSVSCPAGFVWRKAQAATLRTLANNWAQQTLGRDADEGEIHWLIVNGIPANDDHISAFYEHYPLKEQVPMWREAGIQDAQAKLMSFGAAVVIWGTKRG